MDVSTDRHPVPARDAGSIRLQSRRHHGPSRDARLKRWRPSTCRVFRSVNSFPPSPRNDRPQFPFDRMRIVARSTWPAKHKIIAPRFCRPFPRQITESRRIAIFDPCDRDGYFVKTQLDLMRKREKRCAYADGHRARRRVHEDLEGPTQYVGAPFVVQARQEFGAAANEISNPYRVVNPANTRSTMYGPRKDEKMPRTYLY